MSQNCKKDHHQKTVYYTRSSILVQCHAKEWCILYYSTSQYGLSVLHMAERNQWNTGTDTQSTAGYFDQVWVKTPHGQCTTKYRVGHVTRITSVQNIMVDGMPHHVKDLRPIVGPGQPTVCSDMVSEDASERFVTISERLYEQASSTNAGDASSNNTSNEDQVTILSRRSTRHKRPPPECFMCDHRIRGECSSNATNNLTSKKQKVYSLCYRHAETRRRKGCKRYDLFYEEERDKPLGSGEIWWT